MKRRDEIIWNNVLLLANQKGWNLTKLAKQVGTNTSAINNIKTGTRGIGNKLLKKFAIAFNVDESLLLVEKTQNNYFYNPKNKLFHDSIELILNSDNAGAIGALNYGIKGVLSSMEQESELLKIVKKLVRDVEGLKEGDTVAADVSPIKKHRKKVA